MKLGRRGFIAALGFGAAAAPAVVPHIASSSMNLGGVAGGVAGGFYDFPAPSKPWAGSSLTEFAWKALHQKMLELDQRRAQRWQRRIEGLDPDLWAMRSMSLPARMAVQARRDQEIEEQIKEANFGLFGKPENF